MAGRPSYGVHTPMLLLLAACGAPDPTPWCADDVAEVAPAATAPTWTEVRPVLERSCGACHVAGGSAPFPVTGDDPAGGYWEVVPWAAAIRDAVAARTMPPWQAEPCCRDWHGDPSLTDDEIAALLAWIDAGQPYGDPGEHVDPVGGLSRTDLVLTMDEPYTPPAGDSSRCFVLPWPQVEDTFVTGFLPVPGARSIVHHLVVGVVGARDVPGLQAADEADPEPGFDCSGGLGEFPSLVPLGGGVAGGDYPRGIGHPVAPGSLLVLNLHYSVNGAAQADQSSVWLRLDDEAVEASTIPVANPAWMVGDVFAIPAGEVKTFWYQFRPHLYTGGREVLLEGITPHMHRYATRMRVLAVRDADAGGDGARECLLEIGDWTFGWEQPAWYAEPVTFGPRDELYLECTFDNTAANQPEGEPPRDLAWGDSDQDMCAAFLSFTTP